MQYQRLGNSGLKVSRMMTYGNPQWGGGRHGYSTRNNPSYYSKMPTKLKSTPSIPQTHTRMENLKIFCAKCSQSKASLAAACYYPVLEDDPNAWPNPAVNDGPLVNQVGLSRKHIFNTVEGSLRRLKRTTLTSYNCIAGTPRLLRRKSCERSTIWCICISSLSWGHQVYAVGSFRDWSISQKWIARHLLSVCRVYAIYSIMKKSGRWILFVKQRALA